VTTSVLQHRTPTPEARHRPQSSNIFIYKIYSFTETARFIHINFIITQNHVNDVKCLAWPKPTGGAYSGLTAFPPLTSLATNQEPPDGSCLICIKMLIAAAQLNLTPKPR
jgi:hypothetical protein